MVTKSGPESAVSAPWLQVQDEMPFCRRCRRVLPRSKSDPCRDPRCPYGQLSLTSLWDILEDRRQP